MRFVNIKESSDSRGNNPAFDEKKQLYVPKESGNFLFVELNCLFWLRRTIKEVICKVSLGMADSPGSLQEITVFFCLLFPIFFVFLHTSAWMFLRPGISEKPSAPLCVHCNIPPATLGLAVSRHNSESNEEKRFWFFLIGIVQTCI